MTRALHEPPGESGRLRVVHVSRGFPPAALGGIATYASELTRVLSARGHDTTVLTEAQGDEPLSDALADGRLVRRYREVRVPGRLEARLPNLAHSVRVDLALRRLGFLRRPDIVEFANWDAEGLVTALAPGRRFPIITRVHTTAFEAAEIYSPPRSFGLRFGEWAERTAATASDALYCSTRAHARRVAEHFRIDVGRISIVPLGLRVRPRSESAPHGEGVRVLFVGRHEKRKGMEALFEALPVILDRRPQVTVDLAGEDRRQAPGRRFWREWLREERPDLAARVTFHGPVDEEQLRRLYTDCDLVVTPSLYESFGLVNVEAMLHAKATISTRVGGIPEVVVHGETGLLVPPGDGPALAAAIDELVLGGERRRSLGEAGRRRALSEFSDEVMGARTEALYREVIAARGA